MQYLTTAPKQLRPAFDFAHYLDDDQFATFTDEHTTSSYGLPVLIHNGTPYGPAELPGHIEPWSSSMTEDVAEWLRRGGWAVEAEAVYHQRARA